MQFNSLVTNVAPYFVEHLETKKRELRDKGIAVYDFGTGDPREPTPPFISDALRAGVPEVSQYPTSLGTAELREAVVAYIGRRFGVKLDPATQVLPCTGCKEAVFHLPFLLIGPNDKRQVVIGPEPGYPVYERGAVIAGAEYYPYELNPENDFLLDLAALPASLLNRTALAWINYPYNPVGSSCDLDYLAMQAAVAEKYGFLLCSDECYADITFGAKPHPSILQVKTEGILAFHSCSKRSGMTGYRSGFMAGDLDVLAAYRAFRAAVGVATPVFTQRAATAAWADDKHVAERNAIFGEKRALFLDFLIRKKLEFIQTDATFFLWVKVPTGISGAEYTAKLLERGIVVSPGSSFGKGCEQYFRIALVPSVGECKAAMSIWE